MRVHETKEQREQSSKKGYPNYMGELKEGSGYPGATDPNRSPSLESEGLGPVKHKYAGEKRKGSSEYETYKPYNKSGKTTQRPAMKTKSQKPEHNEQT